MQPRGITQDIEKQLKFQTIGHDKVNQLRHVRYFKDIHGMVEHMRLHAEDVMRQKFEAVIRSGTGAGKTEYWNMDRAKGRIFYLL